MSTSLSYTNSLESEAPYTNNKKALQKFTFFHRMASSCPSVDHKPVDFTVEHGTTDVFQWKRGGGGGGREEELVL